MSGGLLAQWGFNIRENISLIISYISINHEKHLNSFSINIHTCIKSDLYVCTDGILHKTDRK